MTSYCNFPVAKLKESSDMQRCNQKCTYVGNYNKDSTGNTIINQSPYTMCNMVYNGDSNVMFNGVSYSTTTGTNTIEMSLTKPLHTFGDSGDIGVAELIIRHHNNVGGYNDLWVCIPIVSASSPPISTNTTVVEAMINALPGVPYVTHQGDTSLVRMGSGSYPQTNTSSIDGHQHTLSTGDSKTHTHPHIVNNHNISGSSKAITSENTIAGLINKSGEDISEQVALSIDFKLNNVIPKSSYFNYLGLYSVDCSTDATYSSSGTTLINVIVFDISNAIVISDTLAKALKVNDTSNKDSYPLLLDHCYTAIEDTDKNVSYHEADFTNKVASEDDIYIDCQPTDASDSKVLIDQKNNNAIDAGSSIADSILGMVDGPILPLLIGIIAMYILCKTGKFLLSAIFGKAKLPNPAAMLDDATNMIDPK